jgi:hypothetical protein
MSLPVNHRRPLVTVVMMLLLTWRLPLVAGAAQIKPESHDVPLDLAAMALTPADLDDAGFTGYGVGWGRA